MSCLSLPTSIDISQSIDDIDQIWDRNANVPEQLQGCVHHLVNDIATSQPDALAVCAWDGDLAYSQLDTLASCVAQTILGHGVEPGSVVPLLFSKSRWTSVGMLAIIKAGCSAVALDATQPDKRLLSIVEQVYPRAILSSPEHYQRATSLANVPVIQVDDKLLDLNVSKCAIACSPLISPSDIVYISFTSGSTGRPKGACISHANVRSAVLYQGEKLGFRRGVRVFDFAPYSFDVAWSNFLHTICSGGCLCVASEKDMLSDLSSSITAFQASLINVTPTVLRTINPIPSSLETVLLSGEMPYPDNITRWAGRVRLLNTYGPTECTFKCAFSVLTPSVESRPDIGIGVAFSTWIVDPDNSEKLAPIGSVGELYLEGPLVGQGYISDLQATKAAFVSDPAWLLAGSTHHAGRHGRLYKTGDLVRYNFDGKLSFVGRKDGSQLKIRGQRVEIGDVEHHIRACLPRRFHIIVDVITPYGGASEDRSLSVFVELEDQDIGNIKEAMDGLAEQLKKLIPAFMIPRIYFPVPKIPITATGKSDRRLLREMTSALTWDEIIAAQATILSSVQYTAPSDIIEQHLVQIWANTLKLDPAHISTTDSFLRLGGDSITAIFVVAAARERDLAMTVADLFNTPILRDLAQVVTRGHFSDIENVTPFALLSGRSDEVLLREHVASFCRFDTTSVEDIFPCTPLQQGMLAMTAKSQKTNHSVITMSTSNYVARTAFELSPSIDLHRFETAWATVVESTPITRTRIFDVPEEGLVQVVINEALSLRQYPDLASFLEDATPMGLGTRLFRAGIVQNDDKLYYLSEIHHALFDRWCNVLIMDAIAAAYQGIEQQPLYPFQLFIKHITTRSATDSIEFWTKQLDGSLPSTFPPPNFTPNTKADLDVQISGLQWPPSGITASSVIRSALAILLASYSNSEDIIFGATVSGRQAPISGIERIAGPTIGTVPIRVRFDQSISVDDFQKQLQLQALDIINHEHYGLQNIQRISKEMEKASRFQVLLVVQAAVQGTSERESGIFSKQKTVIIPEDQSSGPVLVSKDSKADSMGIYNSYAMMIICHLNSSSDMTVRINYDTGAIKEQEAVRFSQQFQNLIQAMCAQSQGHLSLKDVSLLTTSDLNQILNWNRTQPETPVKNVVDLIDRHANTTPDAVAVSSWDQQLTYKQLSEVTLNIESELIVAGVTKGSIIVLNFEKSSWFVASILAVLRIGAVALPTSSTCSRQRAQDIAEGLRPKLALISALPQSSPFNELVPTLPIPLQPSRVVEGREFSSKQIHSPCDPALILFTSGSTGTPKAIQWNHGVLSSNIHEAASSFGITGSSRVFQFAGYDFDVSIVETLSTLGAGGCLCISSEFDRTNRLAESIHESKANWLGLTPSVSETLNPESLPFVETVIFAGEKLLKKTAMRWATSVQNIYNWYGPAEASVATSYRVTQESWVDGAIGKSHNSLTWLVDPNNYHRLAPIGAISELCIEGLIVATYTSTESQILNESYFFSPQWNGANHQEPYLEHQRRVYKTGDLVKYSPTGDIVFLGRKYDSQRKLRGLRIDLSEIELHVQQFLSGKLEVGVVAEIFTPHESNIETLALFIAADQHSEQDPRDVFRRSLPVVALEEDLEMRLPPHMIPKVYLPIERIPTTHTGKVDRRYLQEIGSALTHQQLAALQPLREESRRPSPGMEQTLQKLWAEIIHIEEDAIYANDNFLRLGGDSIAAMRLVALARTRGLSLSVADVFEAPKLENMAKRIVYEDGSSAKEACIDPFSLLSGSIPEADIRSQAAQLCSVPESRIVDAYPCTMLQQGLLALGAKTQGQYISRSVFGLQSTIDIGRLRMAWEATTKKLTILRTRIVDLPEQGLVQVILDNNPILTGSNVGDYIHEDEARPMDLGTELCRAAIVDRDFIFTIHHCVYDGSSFKMILDELECQYFGKKGMSVTPFTNFIHHVVNIDKNEATDFWKAQLSGVEPRQFPCLPTPLYEPRANEALEREVLLQWPRDGITPSTIIRSAWSILAAQHTATSDVIFAITVSGRQANLRGVENCVGPTISTIPFPVSIRGNESVESLLGRIQKQTVSTTAYEQFGLQNIQRLTDLQDARLLQTLLVVQPADEGRGLYDDSDLFKARSYASSLSTMGTDPFNTYALMLICELTKSGLRLRLSFDNSLIDGKQMARMAHQFEAIIQQLCDARKSDAKIESLQVASGPDLNLFWANKSKPPQRPDQTVIPMIASMVELYPASIAVDAWDGQFTYQQVGDLSDTISQNVLTRGLKQGSVIAICLDKTRWAPVMQLAGMKAGCVVLMLSSIVPEDRIQKVFKNVGVQLAVVSESLRGVISRYTRCCSIEELMAEPSSTTSSPAIMLNDPSAILVSSGSTGEPKQILWNHGTMAANVKGYADSTALNATSRVFQFASYDFDVSTIEVLATLAYGGCICIPSESNRLDGLSEAITHFAANHVNMTPSTAKLLEPKDVPSLTKVVFAGENLTSEDVGKWRQQCSVINWYGPAESSSAVFHSANEDDWYTGVIGGCSSLCDSTYCWVVDPKCPDRLSPFGAVGELALEGPTSAVRYIGNEALSKARFFEKLGFLSAGLIPNVQGRHSQVYLTGDLVRYDTNGKLVYIGRQDAQVKIRGQLVSLVEVECEVRKALQSTDTEVVVDAVTLRNRTGTSLAAFVVAATQSEVDSLTSALNAKLNGILPDYAIPSCYIAVSSIPTTSTGKRNHARLREIGASFEPLRDSLSDQWREPVTMAERTLRGLWSTVLGLDAENISTSDSFLRVGDSIQAMRLVGIARQQGLQLTVAEIFQNPVLVDMAKIMKSKVEYEDRIEPFSLLGPVQETASLAASAAELCHIKKEDVEDLLPCTPLQEGLLALTVKTSGHYVGRNILELAHSIDPNLFRRAWERVVSVIPILRTAIIDLSEHGLVQAILRSQNSWIEAANKDEYLLKESESPMGLGVPLMRCGLFSEDGTWYFALTMHHSIYDGWTMPLIVEFLEGFYRGLQPLSHIPFQSFVKYIIQKDQKADAEYWKSQFEDLEAPQFPAISSSNYQPQTDSTHVHMVQSIARRTDDITPSTIIRTAFAILCSQYTNSSDVMFGTVVDGRKAAVSGIERLAGPTIATVPVRVKIDDQGKIITHLHDVQRQTTDMIPHEQTGLSNISRLSEDAHQACQFQTMLVIQPQEKNMADSTLFATRRLDSTAEEQARRYHEFNSYALSIICSLDDDQIKIEFSFDSTVIICDINTTTDKDLDMIWNWNSEKPKAIERCYHHIFADVVQSSPDAVAATGWDGEVTYAQLDVASTALACRLIGLGVQRNTIIPLCFNKSVLTLVALLGVIKAGAGVVFLDMDLPGPRLESIVQQFNPNLIVSSPENQAIAKTLAENVVIISAQEDLVPASCIFEHSRDDLPFVDPSDYLYAVFTSGTTGTPKGCLIQHRNFSSAVTLQREFLGFSNRARVYDFSSYSFDAVHWTILHTLAAGATLCVPSDVERKSNLTESIRNFKVTHIGPTPSLARLIDPGEIPTMERIYFGGESVTKEDLSRWMPQSTVTIMYGPSECSSTTVFWRVPDTVPDRLPIGYGVGASTWIIDPKSNDRLAPVGTIGELWLEGPLVGIGYLNNKERTEASYLEDPSWLLQGSPNGSVAGRAGRMYRTGDLVKYDPIDGALIFVSRKDTQVKLRGQRIELAEVEYHARNCLARRLAAAPKTTAEVVVPKITGRASLMVFVELKQSEHSKFYQCIEDLKDELVELVPSYMVPAAFMPVEKIPLVVSGKTDRRRLRELGESITLEQFGGAEDNPAAVVELTESQLLLRTLWASILGVSLDKIHSESSFLRLGGDSISAMRLAVLARSHNISLTVQNILKAPRLSQMSNLMENLHSSYEIENEEIGPFSLLKSSENKAKAVRYAAAQCHVEESDIMDIFPCTGVQKSLLSMTAKSSSSYIARPVLKLRKQVDLNRLKKAWEIASKTTAPIICYRIVNVPGEGLVQVHLKDQIKFTSYSSMETFLGQDMAYPMGLGTCLTRFSFVNDTSGEKCLVLTQHHAMYDGYSLNLLLNEVSNIYSGIAHDSAVAPFQAFVKHIGSMSKEESRQFWQSQFADSDTALFPELPGQGYQPKADSTVKHDIFDLEWPERDETPSNLIRAAWSILTARYTDTYDVVFGAMVTGRQAPLPGIDRMIAPLANAVPVRVKFDPEQSVNSLLHDIQQQSIDMIAFEQTELLDIRRIDANTERGTRFNTLLVVQPPLPEGYGQQEDSPFLHRFESISGSQELDDFNPNAVMVMCQLSNVGGLQLEISFDSSIIATSQMELIAHQFEHVLRQICVATTETVQDISMASPRDMQTLWKWNSPVPEAINECIPDLIGKMVKEQPDAPAICAWDGTLSYSELNTLSDVLALYLVSLGAKAGTRVPLCFEKSMWYPVAALGAMKTGAACIAIDSTQPEARLSAILSQIDPIFVLLSPNNSSLVKQLSTATSVIVSQQYINEYSSKLVEGCLPKISASDTLYIVFTSGSTGTPKGIITSHRNFASAALHQADILHIKRGTRVFDFVSYSFDVSWSNHLQTLICGGCLCIPSEWERKNDIIGAFNRMSCTYSYFTPSVAQSLDPALLPGLRTLAMGGEVIRGTEVARWKQHMDTVIGIYGPAECAQALSFACLSGTSRNGHVGFSYGARTWLVQPDRPDRLAAIGTVGDLVIEGPTVSEGYFKGSDEASASYIDNPSWLTQGSQDYPGRSGTVYRTGDLLRYNEDGSMDFIGRKDSLIKLRGQRIELAEVEYHVRSCLGADADLYHGIVAEIIIPQNSNSPLLAIFASLVEKGDNKLATQDAQAQSMRRFEQMERKLSDVVPIYMVPAAYIHVDKIPMTTTNKTDRKSLLEIGGKLSQKQLAQLQAQGNEQRAPNTALEKKLQALWSMVLGIDPGTISAESHFFRIGGESIAAMQLVAASREQSLSFSVSDVFKAPRLHELASLLAGIDGNAEVQVSYEPFSLAGTSDYGRFINEYVQPVLDSDIPDIQDIVPATDFQERAVLDAMQDPPGRYPHWIFDLPPDVDFMRMQEACYKLVKHYDILRTIFIKGHGQLWQVSLNDMKPDYDLYDAQSNELKSFIDGLCEDDLRRPRKLGLSFIRFMAIRHDSGSHRLVFRISHSQFDGYSWPKVLETLSTIYNNQPVPITPNFVQYSYFCAAKKDDSIKYWASRLADSSFPSWSSVATHNIECSPDERLSTSRTIAMPATTAMREGISNATVFHAACALAFSRQFSQTEVIFGRLVTGRSMLPSSLQSVVGPTMTELPVRVEIKSTDTLDDVSRQLHEQFIQDSTHEAAGMVEIIRNCTNWPERTTNFGWRTAFQQADNGDSFNFLGSPSNISFYQNSLPARDRPEIYATPRNGNFELEFEGNKRITSEQTMLDFIALLQSILDEKLEN
ncbi:unnamed protein product [Clonostachys rosea]|uniref:Carrier domain-containing protein n=1 Tax=Bionectria ochroleuca TaxID=29856 RepID=A0ABY6UG24_BIOOC|nr:unnamed protein product [Clonostachys rosea]